MKASRGIPQDKSDAYDRLIATNPKIQRKGKIMPYSSHNGHMFSYLSSTGSMGLRLPKKERDDFMNKDDTGLDVRYGAIMKEFVKVAPGYLKTPLS